MSKADSIQRKLWKAYGKVAKTLGTEYEVYRAATLVNPLIDQYYIDTKPATFSQDYEYRKQRDEGVSIWNCWIDGRLEGLFDIQQGDHLLSHLTGDTYYIASAVPHLDIIAIKTNNVISINRSGYAEGDDGFGVVDVPIGVDIPTLVYQPKGAQTSSYDPARSEMFSTLPAYDMYLFDPLNEIEVGDAITDKKGQRTQVTAVYVTDNGTHLSTIAYDES